MKFKDILVVIALSLIFPVVMFSLFSSNVQESEAQVFGRNYFWADSIYTTTAAIDCVYSKQWIQITIYADTVDIFFRAGAPDTASWSSRDWIKLEAGASISFGPATPLKRFEWKSFAGVDYVYQLGYKRVAQY